MTYMSDTMRVELSIPVHIMLAVLVSGANCADPGPQPFNTNDPRYMDEFWSWNSAWANHKKKVETDPEFAKSYKVFMQTKTWLMEACEEALRGVYPEKKEMALLRRIERVHAEMVEPYVKTDSPDPRKIGIIAFYLLQHLVETETLLVPEDSPFGRALEYMLPALSPWEGSTEEEVRDYDNLNRSARKQVIKILRHLQNEGYYQGIPLPDSGENIN